MEHTVPFRYYSNTKETFTVDVFDFFLFIDKYGFYKL